MLLVAQSNNAFLARVQSSPTSELAVVFGVAVGQRLRKGRYHLASIVAGRALIHWQDE